MIKVRNDDGIMEEEEEGKVGLTTQEECDVTVFLLCPTE